METDAEIREHLRKQDARGKLKHAAPELLEALQGLLGWASLARHTFDGIAQTIDNDPCWTKAREAVKKATD